MIYGIAADIILIFHLTFIIFVMLGGLIVMKWRKMAWFHIPAVVWGAAIEFAGMICPLTPLENMLRQSGGEQGYSGSFIGRYLVPVVYPGELTREIQILLGMFVVAMNVVVYGILLMKHR